LQTAPQETQTETRPRLQEPLDVTPSLGSGQWNDADQRAFYIAQIDALKLSPKQSRIWERVLRPAFLADGWLTRKSISAGCIVLADAAPSTATDLRNTIYALTGIRFQIYEDGPHEYPSEANGWREWHPSTAWSLLPSLDGVRNQWGGQVWGIPHESNRKQRGLYGKPFKRSRKSKRFTAPEPTVDDGDTVKAELERCATKCVSRDWVERNADGYALIYATLIRVAAELGSMDIRGSWEMFSDAAGLTTTDGRQLVEGFNFLQQIGLIEWGNGKPRAYAKGHFEPVAGGEFTWVRLLPVDESERTSVDLLPNPQRDDFTHDELGTHGYVFIMKCLAGGTAHLPNGAGIARITGRSPSSGQRLRDKLLKAGAVYEGRLIAPLAYTAGGNDSKLLARQDRRLTYARIKGQEQELAREVNRSYRSEQSGCSYMSISDVGIARSEKSFSKEEAGSADLEALRERIMAHARAQKLEDEKHEAPSLQNPEARALAELQSLIIGHRGLARLEEDSHARDGACAEPLTSHTTPTPQSSVSNTKGTECPGNELDLGRILAPGGMRRAPEPETKTCSNSVCKRSLQERFYDSDQWLSEKPTCRPCVFQYEKQLAAMAATRLERERVRAEAKARQKKAGPRVRRK
jgi:hypothetical protein